MKLSDFVASFVCDLGVRDVFLISGGGMMHLLDSFGNNEKLNIVCNLNEQASSICADSYSQLTKNIGVCMLTTGPGGTNAVTGIAASYLDSIPVLAISGQCKTADCAIDKNVRVFGAQEVDIVSIVKPITKYSIRITDKNSIKYHLEKAVHLAKSDRPGPVWIDIPLDIQSAQVNPDELKGFVPENQIDTDISGLINQTIQLLSKAKRPLVLIGGGAMREASETLKQWVQALGLPVLTTWRAKDFLHEEHDLYFGMPGAPAYRYSNYILQNCDLLITVGTRLNAALTIYDERNFAPYAKKVMVDIDENEIKKMEIQPEVSICVDAINFAEQILSVEINAPNIDEWIEYCKIIKQKYPLDKEIQPYNIEGLCDGYKVGREISVYSRTDDVFVGSSSGRTCGISHMALQLKEGQRFVSSMGLGSMGFVVPSTISACLASGKKRTIALEGDGSLQHNIQELALIRSYNLPIKLFVLTNGGYASIYMMQKNNFGERYTACHQDSGVTFPTVKSIAEAYKIGYRCIENDSESEQIIKEVMSDDIAVICEVKCSIYFDEIPKSMTIANNDGTFSSSKLENLYPFLPENEVMENMRRWE